MRISFMLFLSLCLISCSVERRIVKQGEEYIQILASDSLHGRGYTHNGLNKAENYIRKEFKNIGLEPFYPNYKQPTEYSINIIESSDLKVNKTPKQFGIDYLLNPNIKTTTVNAYTFLIENNLLERTIENDKQVLKTLALNKGKIPVLDYRNTSDSIQQTLDGLANYLDHEKTLYHFPALIKIKEKLTHSLANEQDNFAIIETNQNITDNDFIELEVISNLNKTFKSNNIVGKINGSVGDSAIFIIAHYDHLGQINQTIFNGANDNASGVSMLLSLASYFKQNQPKNDIYFYALTGEEAGLIGAEYAANHLPLPKEKIIFLLNLDIVGTGEEGIQVVNSKIYKDQYALLSNINEKHRLLKQIKTRGEACNSDHCPFYRKGIPSFFIYTLGGIDAYHDPFDKANTLPLTEYYDLYQLLTKFIEQL